MQYCSSSSSSWIDIGSNEVTNLAAGNYLVRTRASAVTIASDTVNVGIAVSHPTQLPKEHTPGAEFNAQIMVLSNIQGTKYSLDGGNNWIHVHDYDHVQLNSGDVHADKGIIIYRPGNGTTTADSDRQTISLKKAGAPTGVGAISATSAAPGAITGLNSSMEYGPKGGTWTAATTSAVSVVAGVYYVRTKGAYTTLPSDPVEVDIKTAATPVVVTPTKPKTTAAPATTTKQNTTTQKTEEKTEEPAKETETAEVAEPVAEAPAEQPTTEESIPEAIAEAEEELAEIEADEDKSLDQAATGTDAEGVTDNMNKKSTAWIWVVVVIMLAATAGFVAYLAVRKRRR